MELAFDARIASVFTKYPLESYSYIDRSWSLHLVYAVVGFCFAWAWHRRSAPRQQ